MKPAAFQKKPGVLSVLPYFACFAPLFAYLFLCGEGAFPFSLPVFFLFLLSCLAPFSVVLSLSLRKRKLIAGLSGIVEAVETGDLSTDLVTLEEGDLGAIQHAIFQLANEARHTIRSGQAQKEYLQEFVSHISHQMKNPISALSMYHELMLDNPDMPKEDASRFLRRGEEQLHRLEWLIGTLLQIARLEADSIVMKQSPSSLRRTLSQAVATFRDAAALKGIRLSLKESEDYLLLQDEKWLTQAFENLIKNAVEHTGQGGRVEVSMGQNNFFVWVTVQDTGSGMDRKQIKHIFDAFYSRKDDDSSSSTGLGLSLCKSIIQRHNGEIYVKSKKGEGSRFEITFPKNSGHIGDKSPETPPQALQ